MIKAIIFDWHGVLDFTTFEDLAALIAKESKKSIDEVKQIFKKVKGPLIRGESDSSLLWTEINKNLDLSEGQLDLIKEYRLKIEKNHQLFDFLSKIQSKYKLAILSDCPKEKAYKIKKSIDLSVFSPVIFSCEVGNTKSEDVFFTDCAIKLGLNVSDILYVDDTEKHINTTKLLGFQTHHFIDTQSFIKRIEAFE
jgi:HAD superfamily hydrolase (TIGR01509 family)